MGKTTKLMNDEEHRLDRAPLASSTTTTMQSPSLPPHVPCGGGGGGNGGGGGGGNQYELHQHHMAGTIKVNKQSSNVSHLSKQTTASSTTTTTTTSHQHFQQLPPTPPAPTLPTSHAQLNSSSTRIQHAVQHTTILNANQTLPSFLITPSPTPITTSQSSTSKSKFGLNLSLNKSAGTLLPDTSTPTLKAGNNRTLNKFNQRQYMSFT